MLQNCKVKSFLHLVNFLIMRNKGGLHTIVDCELSLNEKSQSLKLSVLQICLGFNACL